MKIKLKTIEQVILCAIAFGVGMNTSNAATAVWNNASTGAWETGANWTGGTGPGGVPASTDAFQISQGVSQLSTTYTNSGGGNVGQVSGTGQLDILSGGTFTSTAFIGMGTSGSTGIVNVGSGGSFSIANPRIGSGTNAIGTLSLSGTASGAVTATMLLGNGAGSTGTLNMSGSSTLTVAGGGNALSIGQNTATGTGVLNISGTSVLTVNNNVILGNSSASGTLNLNGGTISASGFNRGTGTGIINANGGTLQGRVANANFLSTNTVNLLAGGLTIDTNTFALTVANNMSGVGGLTKEGAGTLTLSGTPSYSGDTTVRDGILQLQNVFLSDAADIFLETGGIMALNFVGTDTIDQLLFDGAFQNLGTWGAIGSGADNESAFFTGTGLVEVTAVPEPSTYALLVGGLFFFWVVRRKRTTVEVC
jgi:autotransporter-associated beta strand protein